MINSKLMQTPENSLIHEITNRDLIENSNFASNGNLIDRTRKEKSEKDQENKSMTLNSK